MRRITTLSVLLLLTATAGAQETAYVTDMLQLGLHRAEDTSDSPFRNLASGTALTVLERVASYARVRTADGEEGWVRSAFLVNEKPALLRVTEAEAAAAELERELEAVIAQRDSAKDEAAGIVASAELELAAAEVSRDTLARLQRESSEYQARLELYRGAIPWPWVLAALVVVLGAGFVGGWWWLDASIRRRYGGFRVY